MGAVAIASVTPTGDQLIQDFYIKSVKSINHFTKITQNMN
jgi:hypothetical protein